MVLGGDWVEVAAILAGGLIAGVGGFVLAAKPGSPLHRLFFVLALLDGASTALYAASQLAPTKAMADALRFAYWIAFLPFLACLAGFGVIFPRPPLAKWRAWAAIGAIGLAGAALMALVLARPAWFWTTSVANGAVAFAAAPAGNVAAALFELTVAGLVARLTLHLLRERSESYRAQEAYVLGGMTLAYAPGATTALVTTLAASAAGLWTGRLDRIVARDAFALLALALVVSAALLLARGRRGQRATRFALGCYAAVVVLSVLALAAPGVALTRIARVLGFLVYPLLLGYAIARYEVFDIDAKLRRAATVTVATVVLAGAFVILENLAQGIVQDDVLGMPSGVVTNSVAAILTTLLFIPVSQVARKVGARVVPRLTLDEERARKVEVYRHAVEGALADGIVEPDESRTLQHLRIGLGLTQAEHDLVVAEVMAQASATSPEAPGDAQVPPAL